MKAEGVEREREREMRVGVGVEWRRRMKDISDAHEGSWLLSARLTIHKGALGDITLTGETDKSAL